MTKSEKDHLERIRKNEDEAIEKEVGTKSYEDRLVEYNSKLDKEPLYNEVPWDKLSKAWPRNYGMFAKDYDKATKEGKIPKCGRH